jgi:hypothetical protein
MAQSHLLLIVKFALMRAKYQLFVLAVVASRGRADNDGTIKNIAQTSVCKAPNSLKGSKQQMCLCNVSLQLHLRRIYQFSSTFGRSLSPKHKLRG